MDSPKVLVGCAISSVKDYILRDWIEYVKSELTYDNYDIYLVDNSPDPYYYLELAKEYDIEIAHVAQKGRRSEEFITECQNMIRHRALSHGYDYWMSLECDIIPPQHIIERFVQEELPVIGAPYMIGKAGGTYLIQHIAISPNGYGEVYEPQLAEALMFLDGGIKRVYGMGIGCTLIHRSVLEKFPLRVTKDDVGHSDSFFYQDCLRHQIPVYMDTSVVLRHEASDWGAVINLNENDHE